MPKHPSEVQFPSNCRYEIAFAELSTGAPTALNQEQWSTLLLHLKQALSQKAYWRAQEFQRIWDQVLRMLQIQYEWTASMVTVLENKRQEVADLLFGEDLAYAAFADEFQHVLMNQP